MKLYAMRAAWDDSVEFLGVETSDGKRFVAKPLIFDLQDDGCVVEPTFRMSNTEAQNLMDALWQCGLRPSEGTGSAGSLKATQDHLKDMQKIAFHFLENQQ